MYTTCGMLVQRDNLHGRHTQQELNNVYLMRRRLLSVRAAGRNRLMFGDSTQTAASESARRLGNIAIGIRVRRFEQILSRARI